MKRRIYVLIGLIVTGCIEPYNPPEVVQAENYLVVDAFLDVAVGEATVKLSRTQNLDDGGPVPVESGAQIEVQTETGASFPFLELTPGEYQGYNVAVGVQEKCRLYVRTAGGREYLSNYVVAQVTPPIDSVTWSAESQALNFQVTTHDPSGQTEFYRWSMVETAQYYSRFYSPLIYDPDNSSVRVRDHEELIYTCWKETPLSAIKVATSRGFAVDLIDKYTLVSLDATSWKHRVKYSLLVKQYAISESEFNYWTQLKKNTESVGTIFDPQPSEPLGNVRSVSDPSEPVLGYFSAGTVASERIFVHSSDLPYSFYITGYESCSPYLDTLTFADFFIAPESSLIVAEIANPMGLVYAYGVADHFCVDCRLAHEGATTKPDYWQ